MINPKNYRDLLIVSNDGTILYTDFSNVSFMKLKEEPLKGRILKDVFVNIDDAHPVLRAAKEGMANPDFTVRIETCTGQKFKKTGCTYPIYKEGLPFAAVEFSDICYSRQDVREIETLTDYSIYRDNGTMYSLDNIITEDSGMILLKKEIEQIALTGFPVLIYGNTGTGKELVAQSIHNSSSRFSKKFVSVNCGTIPENLAESMLFGTRKGSFTDSEDTAGFFEQAEGGTLFLDEINSLSPQIQVKLLRAVELNVIRRIGDTGEKQVDVRVVAATNEDPQKLMGDKRLLPDFYHRIAASVLYLPELIDRGDDVVVLANHFINYFNRIMNTGIGNISGEIAELFRNYSWPGNIRELRNVIEGAFAFTESDEIKADDMPAYIMKRAKRKCTGPETAFTKDAENRTLAQRLARTERRLIESAMKESGYRLSEAAELLGISKQLLKYKADKHHTKENI